MNYEKSYKEAFERAKNLHKDAIDMGENIRAKQCEIIFHELKESEDEKIRKYLLKLADRCPEDSIDFMRGVKKGDIIAWLEKQGEKTINQPDFEIPFGAKDSELIEESYYIPKGYHAEISKDKVTIKKGEQKQNSQNAQDLIEKYVSDHEDCRWLNASELEQLLNDFVLEYDVIKNREYEQQYKVSNDGNNR